MFPSGSSIFGNLHCQQSYSDDLINMGIATSSSVGMVRDEESIKPKGEQDGSPLSNLECSICKKYLSVAPIFISSDGKTNICGRCKPESMERLFFTRNIALENALTFIKLPCSVSKNCKTELSWNDVQTHEDSCKFKPITCPVFPCKELIESPNIFIHFKNRHPSRVFLTNKLELPLNITNFFEKTVVLLRWCYVGEFLVYLYRKEDLIHLDVYSVNSTKSDFAYSAKILLDNAALELTNNSSIFSFSNVLLDMRLKFKYSTLTDIFVSKTDEPTIILNIFKPNTKNIAELYKEFMKSTLECPVCFQTMTKSIFLCLNGHSMCHTCRKKLDSCPVCRCTFTNGRNFLVESLYSKFAKTISPGDESAPAVVTYQ